jgi:hypothetical protein
VERRQSEPARAWNIPHHLREINVRPRAFIDRLSAKFSLLISLGVLCVVLLLFLAYDVNSLVILAMGLALTVFNVAERKKPDS